MFKRTRKAAEAGETVEAHEVVASVRTDVGCVRGVNEDSGRCFRPSDPALLASRGVLTVVADGMGGHAAGEVASRLAVEAIGRVYYREPGDAAAALKAAFAEANREIYAAASGDESLRGMGTTGTALALPGGVAVMAHVGDSRLYMLRGGELYQLTEDHSAVMELVKRGVITPDEARTHADKNVIVRALGTGAEVEVAAWGEPLPVRGGDLFLLCSDGLCDLVGDDEIGDLMASAADPHDAAERLVAKARERGGHDNITVGVVGVEKAGGAAPPRPRETRELEVAK